MEIKKKRYPERVPLHMRIVPVWIARNPILPRGLAHRQEMLSAVVCVFSILAVVGSITGSVLRLVFVLLQLHHKYLLMDCWIVNPL